MKEINSNNIETIIIQLPKEIFKERDPYRNVCGDIFVLFEYTVIKQIEIC